MHSIHHRMSTTQPFHSAAPSLRAAGPTAATPSAPAAGLGAAAEFALRTVTEVQAAVLSHTSLQQAAACLVREVATRLDLSRVSLGLLRGGQMSVVSDSDGLPASGDTAHAERLAEAMAEASDQMAVLCLPAPQARAAEHPRVTLAQERLLQAEPGAVATVPVVFHGQALGALCAQHGGGAITAQQVALLEQVAALAAPVLQLMQANERPWHRRLRDQAASAWRGREGGGWAAASLGLRGAVLGGGLLLAAWLLWPSAASVGGAARLEGAVQRTLVAPMDGFIGQVHVRPGDAVRAGQLLAELSGQELQIERARWESQVAQHENAVAGAQAASNRAQLAIAQSRSAEAEAQLALVSERLERSRILAPFDGVVIQGDLSQQLGAPVQQGAELMVLAPQGQFRVIVAVDERDIGAVSIGQEGRMALSALPWDTLALRVVRITPVATVAQGRNVYEVEATLSGAAPAGLRPGLQGSALLQAGQAPRLLNWSRRLVEAARLAWWEVFG